ncbi:hypothetical protein [Sulfurovum sp.]|uniref:hypothetical protein n=1 Tax=Sulfurovum sp. TaxID=1969726 RepID=UPI0025EAD690|nr:hypothetical protein [Sulfurovum sp.]
MVKKIAMALVYTALGSSLYAGTISEGEKFIGLEVGATEVQGDVGGVLGELDHKENGVEFGLRVGAQTEQWRSMVLLNYFDKDDQNTEKLMVTVDYFFLNSTEEQNYFKPYLGANAGYMNYESTNVDENGFLYGAQAGFVVEVMESMDIDIGYRYSLSTADKFDHTGSVVFGMNYLY